MTVSDLEKKVTFGDPDGPEVFVAELDQMVPTFVDPRNDLVPEHARGKFKRLNHHVPFLMRGMYQLDALPVSYRKKISRRTDLAGFVLCEGNRKDGGRCSARAVNRSPYCRNHGGALHPADKRMSSETITDTPPDRVANLDRTQKFMQGFLLPEDLNDDEVQGMFVRNDQGVPIAGGKLGAKFQQLLTKELHSRLNTFLQTKTPAMLNVMVDIAESDLVEPADRIKAAIWVSERTMGKTPEVVIHGKTDKPYESIFERLETGSRDAYRQIESSRPDVVDAEVVPFGQADDYSDPELDEIEGDTGSEGTGPGVLRGVPDDRRIDAETVHDHGVDPRIPIDDPKSHAQKIIDQRKAAKELRERISKSKRRRFAARANGVGLQGDIPWLIDWKRIQGGLGTLRATLVPPEYQTQARIDRIAFNDDITNVRVGEAS